MPEANDRRSSVTATQTLNARPHEVFPLLCPVREFDWIKEWSCKLISSRTGIAEPNCVFTTKMDYGHSKSREEVWMITRYEPERAIEFVKFCADFYVLKYDVWLTPLGPEQTRASWTQTRVPLSREGKAALEKATQGEFQAMIAGLEEKLNHFLETGKMLVIN